MPNNDSIAQLFVEDCVELIHQSNIKLQNCLQQLSTEQIWWRSHPSTNSVGNLILHICGNLRQWTLAGLAGQPDSRDRDHEFSSEHSMTADQLLEHLQKESDACLAVLPSFGPLELVAEYTIQGFLVNGLQAVNHTVTHFVGHTHQVVYMTRLQLGDDYQFAWSPDDGRDRLPI